MVSALLCAQETTTLSCEAIQTCFPDRLVID